MRAIALAATALALGLSGCVAPVGPVEVTRFHVADTAVLGHGTIAVVPAPSADGQSLAFRAYQAAVLRELVRLGYTEAGPDTATQIAELRLERQVYRPERARSPVSVGVSGSTGSYGTGLGMGLGIDLSGPPKQQTETRMGVMIRDSASKASLWEGRASFTVRSDSPLAGGELGAAKLAEALFKGFPGELGETIEVK